MSTQWALDTRLNISAFLSVQMFTNVSILLITLLCLRCAYYAFMHPLSKYPGPFLAKFTDAYAVYHSFRGDLHLDMLRNHQIHGHFVRYGPNRLLVDSINGLHDIYGNNPAIQKSDAYITMVPVAGANTTATSISKNDYKPMRRTLAHGFTQSNLVKFEHSIIANTDKYCYLLLDSVRTEGGWCKPRNMDEYNTWLGLDTMSSFGFGTSTGFLDSADFRFVADVIKMHMYKLSVFEEMPVLDKFGLGFGQWHAAFMDRVISLNRPHQHGVFAPAISRAKDIDPKGSHTKLQAIIEGSFNVLTSADTHAGTFSALQFYLLRFPHAYEKLRAEIRAKFPTLESLASGPALSSCTYLHACISEALRFRPAEPAALWRTVVGSGTTIDGAYVPSGVDVGVCTWAIHQHSAYFRRAGEFWPERWLPDVLPADELQTAHAAFKPFSLGPRSCIGRAPALHALALALARMVLRVDMRLPQDESARVGEGRPGNQWGRQDPRQYQFESHFAPFHDGPYASFRHADVIES